VTAKHKILFYDIETAPMISYRWSPKVQFVPNKMNISDYYMLTFAAKWEGQKKVISDCLMPHELRRADDDRLVLKLADLMREADVVVAHNGDRFDYKKVNWRAAINEQEPLGPVRSIDTLKLSRASFGPGYHNLDSLALAFLGEHKIATDFTLWERTVRGDEPAMREMLRYNRKDVDLLERVYNKMLPYVKTLPRLVDGEGHICPACGSDSLTKRGVRTTNAFNYQRYQCNDCLRYSSEKVRMPGGTIDLRPA